MTDARTFAEIAASSLEPAAKKASSAIVLRLDKPFSTNAMYRSFSRGGKGGLTTIKSKAYRDWQARALGLIATQKWTPIEGCYGIQIKLPKDTRIDADNVCKAYLDTLRHAGIVIDDSPKYLRRLEVIFGLALHTTITIKPLETTDALD